MLWVAASTLFFVCCSAGDGGSDETGDAVDGGATVANCGNQADAPNIVQLTTNTSSIDQNSTLTITAIVSDPQGIADLIGGSLHGTLNDTEVTYGSFSTSADEGSYSLTLGWNELDTALSIELAPGDTVGRTLRARFFDQAGNTCEKDVQISVGCALSSEGTCGGSCMDLFSDRLNCGACATDCADVLPQSISTSSCEQGVCGGEVRSADETTSCAEHCANAQLVCDQPGFLRSECSETNACVGYENGPSLVLLPYDGCDVVPQETGSGLQAVQVDCYCQMPPS